MRYTMTDVKELADQDIRESPVVVEVVTPDRRVGVLRDHAGNAVGQTSGREGALTLSLHADAELLERLEPLRQALGELEAHIDALHTVERKGAAPESPEDEAAIRDRLRFPTLLAHAVMAVEIHCAEG